MSNSDIARRAAARLQELIETDERNTRCGRIDMELADYEKIGNNEYKIMIEYSPDRGVPSPSQITEWTTASFTGNLRLSLASVRNHPELNSITAIVEEVNIPQPAYRKSTMVPVGAGRYASADGNIWSMRGEKEAEVLVRERSDDMTAILEDRVSRQRDGRYARVHLGMVRTAGVANLEVGDKVVYAEPGGGAHQKVGKISSVGADTVKIQGREGSIPRSYVVDVVDKSPAAVQKQNEFLKKFFDEYLFAGTGAGKKLTIKPDQV